MGQLFAWTAVAEPRLAAALMGMLVKGLGADHILWGTDAVWTGAPQWQIEGLRRIEVPVEMQKRYGFKPLGPADGPVKNAIFAENTVRLYNFDKRAELAKPDRYAEIKADLSKRPGAQQPALRLGPQRGLNAALIRAACVTPHPGPRSALRRGPRLGGHAGAGAAENVASRRGISGPAEERAGLRRLQPVP